MANVADNDTVFNNGVSVLSRINEAAKALGINTQFAVERFVCEEMSRGLSAVMPARHYVKGGVIFPQVSRETRDLDISFVRKVSDGEMVRAMHEITPLLAEAGIVVTKVHTPKTLVVGGEECLRIEIEATVAKAVIKVNVDATGGIAHQPINLPRYGQGSTFFKGQVPLTAHFQSYEAQLADKLSSIVLRSNTAKWRHFADVAVLSSMRLDKDIVAEELAHRMRQRFASEAYIIAVLPALPASLDPQTNAEKAQPWALWVQKHGRGMTLDIDTMLATCRGTYTEVRQIMLSRFQQKLRPRAGRFAATSQAQAVAEIRRTVWGKREDDRRESNVIQMGDYRDPMTLAFRPKFSR
ncbi:nucleotidyl transferase AbiEii/AbiGii toxin family protein [Rhizobium leguminosarum]|uniref:nucleotidyl transferase AbiEii/AbiGii toxin family protein n=1 Tax=Rhizobium leguminosarum TaxID=384 RepID=UPI003F958875